MAGLWLEFNGLPQRRPGPAPAEYRRQARREYEMTAKKLEAIATRNEAIKAGRKTLCKRKVGDTMEGRMFTVNEVSQRWRVSERRLRELIKAGDMRVVKFGRLAGIPGGEVLRAEACGIVRLVGPR